MNIRRRLELPSRRTTVGRNLLIAGIIVLVLSSPAAATPLLSWDFTGHVPFSLGPVDFHLVFDATSGAPVSWDITTSDGQYVETVIFEGGHYASSDGGLWSWMPGFGCSYPTCLSLEFFSADREHELDFVAFTDQYMPTGQAAPWQAGENVWVGSVATEWWNPPTGEGQAREMDFFGGGPVTAVPEPSSFTVLASSLCVLGYFVRRVRAAG